MKSTPNPVAANAVASNQIPPFLSARSHYCAALLLLVSALLCATSRAQIAPPAPTVVNSAQAAAEEVHRQAQIAAGEFPDDPNASKSYGVGGAIVENVTGRIIHAWGNRVNGKLESGMWFASLDPTNHGETQLVAWYYANRTAIQEQLGYLPAPEQLTVVTSLDPCAMCAGTLLTAGFNVAVVAPDDSGGGVNWAGTAEFAHVPPAVRSALRTKFGYYKVTGDGDDEKVTGVALRSNYTGGPNVIFRDEAITEAIYNDNFFVFQASVAQVDQIRRDTRQSLGDLADIAPAGGTPADATALRAQLVARWPGALSVKLDTEMPDAELEALGIKKDDLPKKNYFRPDDALYSLLQTTLANAPESQNALAMIDPFGNVLVVEVDKPAESPIATAMMNIASGYSKWAFDRISEASTNATNITLLKQTPAYKHLPPVARNTFIYLKAPTPDEVSTLKDLGIFGNTGDGVLQYIEPPVDGTMKELDDQVWALPLYYIQSENVSAVQSIPPPPAVQLIVTTLADTGTGSLRAAIEQANAAGRYRRITFADDLQGMIVLGSALPVINVPVSIDGRSAVVNPYAPRFGTAPRVGIDFNNHPGLELSASATGSQVIGLALGGAGGHAISSLTRNLEITHLRFGVDQAGEARPNVLGWFGGVANQAVITLPESPLLTISRLSDITRPLVFSSSAMVSRWRLDSNAGLIYVGFAQGTDYFALDPSAQGSVTTSVTAGLRTPAAILPTGEPLTLTWLSLRGGTATAEFSIAPKDVLGKTNKASLLPYLGKTWTVSFNVPAATSRPSYSDWVGAWGLSSAISNGTDDPDGDGFDNNEEYAFGGDPTSPTPNLFHISGSSISYLGLTDDDTKYSVQTKTNLATGPWTNYLFPQTNSSDQLSIPLPSFYQRKQLTIPLTPGTNGFYRVNFSNP
ncbi:MAG: hypothetical protein WEB53_08430 [Akkermansiaceae bacterium]